MGEGSLEDQAAALYAARSQPDEERQGKVLARFLELLITVLLPLFLPYFFALLSPSVPPFLTAEASRSCRGL